MDFQLPLVFNCTGGQLYVFGTTRKKLALIRLIRDEDNGCCGHIAVRTYLDIASEKKSLLLLLRLVVSIVCTYVVINFS